MITRRLSNIISNLCPVLLVVCLVWLVFNYRRNDRAQKQMALLIEKQVELENKVYEYRSKEELEKEIFRRTLLYNDKRITADRIYWGTDSLHRFSFDTWAENPKLFFCFSRNTCSPCVDGAVRLLAEAFPQYKADDRIVLAGDHLARSRNDCYGKRLIGNLPLPLKELEAPFFFILDKKHSLSSLHIYNKSNPEKTRIYLKEIKSKL